MKILRSQQSLTKVSSSSGFIVSFLLHSGLLVALFYAPPFLEIKPSDDKIFKINLNTFKPITAPVFAPEPVIAPPAPPPPEPTPPKPPVIKPPEPTPPPIPKAEPKPKPKPKQKPKPTPKPAEPEKVVQAPPAPTQPIVASTPTTTSATPATTTNVAAAPTIGEYNMQSSAGDKNFEQIRRALIKHHKYPKNAIKMRKQGICEVRFVLKSNGDVTNIEVISSSGTQILDESAIQTVKHASVDFPKLPNDVRVKIPITFKLN
ncbi:MULTISPECIES: energy transducer TonB [unclassified Campylobacter]|uniref:energy transducer TonB n=1 Tax=unclassified Campylobacter TaxID=2593542 RepID=UPI003D34FC5E